MRRKLKLFLIILSPVFLFCFLSFRDNRLYPYLDYLKLNSESYVEEIKTRKGKYGDVKDKVVWNSKKLKIKPPKISYSEDSEQRVLAGDPNTWIDINLSTQNLCLFHGGSTNCFAVSAGLPMTPTPTGTFHIWIKLPSTLMSGYGYYLPNVPWTMYFYKGYGVHGTYWHSNFGHPMSHGCVNMRTPDAQFVYERVSVGTRVVVHY